MFMTVLQVEITQKHYDSTAQWQRKFTGGTDTQQVGTPQKAYEQ
jgi:hypothetical protein